MLKSENRKIHHVKCMIYSFVKAKDVTSGPKVDILEIYGKQRLFEHVTFKQNNMENGISIRNIIMQKTRSLI
jgi:hypothetical protein